MYIIVYHLFRKGYQGWKLDIWQLIPRWSSGLVVWFMIIGLEFDSPHNFIWKNNKFLINVRSEKRISKKILSPKRGTKKHLDRVDIYINSVDKQHSVFSPNIENEIYMTCGLKSLKEAMKICVLVWISFLWNVTFLQLCLYFAFHELHLHYQIPFWCLHAAHTCTPGTLPNRSLSKLEAQWHCQIIVSDLNKYCQSQTQWFNKVVKYIEGLEWYGLCSNMPKYEDRILLLK